MDTLRLLPEVVSAPGHLSAADAMAGLDNDRQQILTLGRRYLASHDDEGNGRICDRVCALLTVNMLLEESHLFPFIRRMLPDAEALDDAEIAHCVIKGLIAQLHGDDLRLRHRDTVFAVLMNGVEHHFCEAQSTLFEPLALLVARQPEAARDLALQLSRERRRLAPWFGLAEEESPEDWES